MSNEIPVVAVDLDGVLASWEKGTFYEIGPPISGAQEFIRDLSGFSRVIVHTCRCTPSLYPNENSGSLTSKVYEWLDENSFVGVDSVWGGEGKPFAAAYVDDKGVQCRPEGDDSNSFEYTIAKCWHLCADRRALECREKTGG